MAFEDSTLWMEVKEIIKSEQVRRLYDYKGTLHTEKEDYRVWEITSIETIRDYAAKVGEVTRIVFRLGLGDYVHRFYPYRDNLEFTLKRTPIRETFNNETVEEEEVVVTKYKAVFDPKINPQPATSELEHIYHESLNVTDMVEVHLDMVHRCFEPLRIKTTSGCYQKKKPEELIRSILGGESMKVLVDGKPAIDGLDLVEVDNKEEQHTTIFPHGMKITSVPTYLHERLGGVYNKGIGTFFQVFDKKKLWFVYPLYDTERFDKDGKKMIIYAIPQDKLPQLDRSWKEEGDLLKIVASAQRTYTDSAETAFMNQGSGYRMPDARSYLRKPVEMTAEGPKAKRIRLNHEVATKERKDNLNYLPMVKSGPSQNPFKLRSQVNMSEMAQIDLLWENADPEKIYPGMPCKYIYLQQNQVKELKGTIMFVHIYSNRVERFNAGPFRTVARISIGCEPITKKPPLPEKPTVGD